MDWISLQSVVDNRMFRKFMMQYQDDYSIIYNFGLVQGWQNQHFPTKVDQLALYKFYSHIFISKIKIHNSQISYISHPSPLSPIYYFQPDKQYMSELILSWLNNDMHLSRKVTSFQKDFSNGYLFGEILAKYNQQLNFSEFINKNDKDSKLNNFTLLFETFKSLRVGFDTNLVMDIIEQKEGVSKKILYELKMVDVGVKQQLERSTSTLSAKANKTGLTPLKKVEVGKEKKDHLDSKLFRRGLQSKHKAQKKIDQQQALQKFSDFHQIEKEKERLIKETQMKEIQLRNEHLRNKMRTDFKRVQDFSRQWEKEGVKNWANNMELRKNQSAKDSQYRSKLESSIKQSSINKEVVTLKQVTDDIEQFENKFSLTRNVPNNPVDVQQKPQPAHYKSSMQFTSKIQNPFHNPNPKRPPSGYKSKSNLLVSPDSNQSDYNRKQRDKKRRMMIVNQSKHQSLIQLERRQQQLMFNLHQTSKQEKEIEYEIWRARQNKTIIVENRKLREMNYQEKEEARRLNAEFKNDELLRVMREEHEVELGERMKRHNQLEVNGKVGRRKEVYNSLAEDVLGLLEIVEKCFEHTQNTNNSNIEGPFLDQLFQQFTQKQTSAEFVAEKQLQNYLNGEGVWKFEVERPNGEPTEPEKENSIPSSAINNYYLGNILRDISQKYFPVVQTSQPEVTAEFGMCLLGLECSGKKTIAKHISEQFSLVVIDPEEMLAELIMSLAVKEEGELGAEEREILELAQTGKGIPDELMFHFIKEAIVESPRFVLINYPKTYDQALLLTKALSSIQPNNLYEPSPLESRLKDIHRLVKSTPPSVEPWKLKPCGIDLILWLETSPKVSIDRVIGARVIDGKMTHINNPNLNGCDAHSLQLVDRGISAVEKNSFLLSHVKDCKEWFMKFGVKTDEGEESLCWKEVNANRELAETIQDSLDIVFEVEESKKGQQQQKNQEENMKQEQQQLQQTQLKQKQQLRQKCTLSTNQQLQTQLTLGLSSLTLKPDFLRYWSQLYSKTSSHLLSLYLKAFTNLRHQRLTNITKLSHQKKRFLSQLSRQDRKFEAVKKFQIDYNQFVMENRDMVEEGQTKEELHQRVDDLEDRVMEIIESKRSDVEEERNSFMGSGWLEAELEWLYGNVEMLVQAEIERSFVSQQIIVDYYTATHSLEYAAIGEFSTELAVDGSVEIINDTEYPRVEKLFTESMRIFNKEEAQMADDKNKKGGKAPPKKDEKKAPKKKDEVEEKKEPTREEMEMTAALNTEKAVFRYRMSILKQFAKQELRSLRATGQLFYKQLEKLVSFTEKTELAAMQQLSNIIRGYIEREEMLQRQLEVNVFDVYVHSKLLNFLDPKPVIKPAKEIVFPNKFSIAHLAYMINNLLEEGERFTKRIANHKLLTVLVRTTNHRQTSLRLPESWRTHSFEDYDTMIRNLDFNKSGFVLLENLFVFFILCNLEIPTKERLNEWKMRLEENGEGAISRDQFINTAAWFDAEQAQEAEENTCYFDRPQQLKELLFDELRNVESGLMSVNKLIMHVGLEQFSKMKKAGQTYYSYMFNK